MNGDLRKELASALACVIGLHFISSYAFTERGIAPCRFAKVDSLLQSPNGTTCSSIAHLSGEAGMQ
jgi:hypothetical protein